MPLYPQTPQVQELLERIAGKADDDLPEVLDHVIEWCWPRGDLHYWTHTLNRFDDILARIISEYGLNEVQERDFSPHSKRLLVSILRFSRLLVENCTNRKLYNSYDVSRSDVCYFAAKNDRLNPDILLFAFPCTQRLNHFLLTTDNDVLESTLRLLLRPAQQYSSQGGGRSELPVSVSRLATIALTWAPREHSLDMAEVARSDAEIPAENLGVKLQFYRRHRSTDSYTSEPIAGPSRVPDMSASSVSTPPRPARREPKPVSVSRPTVAGTQGPSNSAQHSVTGESVDGFTTVRIANVLDVGKQPSAIMQNIVAEYDVPVDSQFELFQKIRLAATLRDPTARRQLLICRLLAIACYAHLVQESQAQTQLFLYEPDIIQKTAALVESQIDGDQSVQAAGFYALDGLGRFRSKLSEVLSSISASVNHGILLTVLRSAVEEFPDPQSNVSDHLIDSLFGLIAFITSTSVGSSMIVSAGLVPLLVQLVDTCRSDLYVLQRTVSRAIGLIDSVVYTFPPAFQWFTDAKGLEVFVNRIQSEVKNDVLEYESTHSETSENDDPSTPMGPDSIYGKLSFGRSSLLRNLFKSISHMMGSTGTADGLRGLIDSSLLESVQTIISRRRLFGPQIVALVINIVASFIHNEPTTLSIIQEKKIPEQLLDLFEDDIEACSDVISAVPNAIGAICLNEAGLELFNSRRDAIFTRMFSIFTSPRHVKVLQDRETATMYGQSLDELIRHQPSMKQAVLDATLVVLDKIVQQGSKYDPASSPDSDRDRYLLSLVSELSVAAAGISETRTLALGDVVMDEADTVRQVVNKHDETQQYKNDVLDFMDVTARFLDGFFQTATHCKDFLKSDGPEKLLQFTSLPCLPYNFPASTTADSLTNLLRFMCEISPNAVIAALLKDIKTGLLETNAIWKSDANSSSLVDMLVPSTDSAVAIANDRFRKLISLNTRLHLLSDVLPTLSYGGAKTPSAFITSLHASSTTPTLNQATVAELGQLHRIVAWENILLKATAAPVPSLTKGKAKADVQAPPGFPTDILEDNAGVVQSVRSVSQQGDHDSSADAESVAALKDPRIKNSVALRYIMSQIPVSLTSFFSETTKMLTPGPKRWPDPAQRRIASQVSDSVGQALADQFVTHGSSNESNNFAYATTTIGHITNIIYEERSSVLVHTPVLLGFERAGGIDALLDLYQKYCAELDRHFSEYGSVGTPTTETPDGKEASLRLGHVCGGLKVALNLLQNLSASRPLHESPATTQMAKENPTTGSEPFKPHELLLRLRLAILPPVAKTWYSPWLPNLPLCVNRSVMQTLLHIVQGEGEDAPKPKSAAAASPSTPAGINGLSGPGSLLAGTPFGNSLSAVLGSLGATPATPAAGSNVATGGQGRLPFRRVQADPGRVQLLLDMGFPGGAARHALQRYNNNANAATEYLLAHPEIVSSLAHEPEPPTEHTQPSEANTAAQEASQSLAQGESQPAASATDDGQTSSAIAADTLMNPTSESSRPGDNQTDTAMGEIATVPASSTQNGEASPSDKKPKAPTLEPSPLKAQLDVMRDPVSKSITSRGLELADHHESLVFDVKDSVCIFADDGERTKATLKPLVESIYHLRVDALDTKEVATAGRLHLLALVLNDDLVFQVFDDDLAQLTNNAISSLAASYDQRARRERPAKWLAPLALVASSVFGREEIPLEATPRKSDTEGPTRPEPIMKPHRFEAEAHAFFNLCLRCLAQAESLSHEELLALYRLLSLLTRDPHIATSLSRRNGVATLLRPFSETSKTVRGCQSYLLICLRHIIEATGLLKSTIEQEVRTWFAQARTNTIEAGSLVRHLSQTALREPTLFVEVVKENVEIADFVEAKGNAFLQLIKAESPEQMSAQEPHDNNGEGSGEAFQTPSKLPDQDTAMDDAAKARDGKDGSKDANQSTTIDSVIHLLLSELVQSARERPAVWSQRETKRQAANPTSEGKADTPGDQPRASDEEDLDSATVEQEEDLLDSSSFYVCFLLQTLCELTSSYVACKTSFLNCSKKRLANLGSGGSSTALHATPSKGKAIPGVMTLFLSELAPLGFLEKCEDSTEVRRRAAISNWAMSTIVAVTADVGFHATIAEVSPDLISVRKQILDSLSRAIKDASCSKESIEVRYGRLYALSDLTQRLLIARPNVTPMSTSAGKQSEDYTLHIAKTMLEKSYVTVLTSALADVDLNLPTVKSLIYAILKPLDSLTKVAIKAQSKSENNRRFGDTTGTEFLSESEDGDEDQEDVEREDTPDFYRSSALGMHTGEMGEPHDSMDEDEDETMDDDEMEELDYSDDEDRSDLSDEDDDDDSESDEDDEMSGDIVEVIETDHEDSDDNSDDSQDDEVDELADDDDDEGWMDEDDDEEDEEGFGEGDDNEDALDFVIGEEGQTSNVPDGLAELVGDDLRDDDGAMDFIRGLNAGDAEADDDEGEESMDDSRYEEEEELDLLHDIGLPLHSHQPHDRFGAHWNFANQPGSRISSSNDQHLPPTFFLSTTPQTDVVGPGAGTGGARRHRSRAYAPPVVLDDPASHPLLTDEHRDNTQRSGGSSSRRNRRAPGGSGYHDWAASIEELVGESAVDIFQAIFGRAGREADRNSAGLPEDAEIRIEVSDGDQPARMTVGAAVPRPAGGVGHDFAHPQTGFVSRVAQRSRQRHTPGGGVSREPEPQARPDPLAAIQAFEPLLTFHRRSDEERIVFGQLSPERAMRLRNHVVNALWPRWKDSSSKSQQRDKDQKELLETTGERNRILEQLREMRARLEQNRAEVADLNEQVARHRTIAEGQITSEPSVTQTSNAQSQATPAQTEQSQDVEMAEAPVPSQPANADTPASQANLELASLQQGLQELDNVRNEHSQGEGIDPPAVQPSLAGPADDQADRVIFVLNDREVDITDLGIDREVLAALPEEMQEEVIGQALRERQAATVEGAEETNISPEFLEALPPELRQEVLEQEAEERALRRRSEANQPREGEQAATTANIASSTATATPAPPTQEASLPDNRLPAGVGEHNDDGEHAEARASARIAEFRGLFGQFTRGPVLAGGNSLRNSRDTPQDLVRPRAGDSSAEGGSHSRRDAIQLLDTNGVAAIVRLLFFPGLHSSSNTLQKVLANLAQNGKTRGDILSMLLRILSDGSADTQAIDKSYASMSARAQAGTPNRPGLVKRATSMANLQTTTQAQQAPQTPAVADANISDSFSVAPLSRAGEEAPHLMAARSIETLLHLTSSNDQCALFFLSEDSRFAKKQAVKGKDKDLPQRGSAPLNVLLGLLDKPNILSNAQLVESLVALLNAVTKHIPSLVAQSEKVAQQEKEAAASEGQSSEAEKQKENTPAAASSEGKDGVEGPAGNQAPLQVSKERLACVVRPLATAISSKGFQHTLAIASHLAAIDAAAQTSVVEALQKEAMSATAVLSNDLDNLLATLPAVQAPLDEDDAGQQMHVVGGESGSAGSAVGQENAASAHNDVVTGAATQPQRMPTKRVQSPALPILARPASAQARLLRSLRALEWLCTRSS